MADASDMMICASGDGRVSDEELRAQVSDCLADPDQDICVNRLVVVTADEGQRVYADVTFFDRQKMQVKLAALGQIVRLDSSYA
jgi:hypothetical protein